MVSHLLKKSSLKENEFVVYDQEQIRYKNQIYMGASSCNFLDNGEQLITLERLFINSFGRGLSDVIIKISDHEERLKFFVSNCPFFDHCGDSQYLAPECLNHIMEESAC